MKNIKLSKNSITMRNKSVLLRPLLTLIFILSILFPASAYDIEYNGLYYNILSQEEKTVEVTYEKYDEKSYYRYIPAEINGALKIPEEVQCNNVKYKVKKSENMRSKIAAA